MSSNSGHKLERDTFVMICKGSISYVPRSQTEPANHLIYGIAHNSMTFSRKFVTLMAVPSLQLVKSADLASKGIAKWDPVLTKRVVGFLRPIAKRYFRSEIRDLGRIPAGGALLVSNHSGGPTTTDLPTFAVDFYDRFGY
jgi:hypothetical protein